MGRAGTSIEQQVTSSQFKFEPGRGEIVGASVKVDQIEGYDPKCGLAVLIQRLDANWKRTADEPVEEFLGCGPLAKFHPGNADNSDDEDPADLGEDLDTEGNCIFTVDGAKIDRKSKAAIFSASLQEGGFKAALLNGYAPNLVGLKAEFDQLMLPKTADFKGKNDPTCLILKKGGKVAQWPWDGKGASKAAAPAKPPAKAAAPTKAAAPAAPAKEKAAPPAESNGAGADDDVNAKAIELLADIAVSKAGQTVNRQRIGSALTVLLATTKVPSAMHKPVQALVKSDEWFLPMAETMNWTLTDEGEVTFPTA